MVTYLKQTHQWFEENIMPSAWTLYEDVLLLTALKISRKKLSKYAVRTIVGLLAAQWKKKRSTVRNRLKQLSQVPLHFLMDVIQNDCDLELDLNIEDADDWLRTKAHFRVIVHMDAKNKLIWAGVVSESRI
jgi:hypothetical protein